jgi:hypothetical protein
MVDIGYNTPDTDAMKTGKKCISCGKGDEHFYVHEGCYFCDNPECEYSEYLTTEQIKKRNMIED